MAKFCPHCGKELKDGENFCSGCGRATSEQDRPVPQPPQYRTPPDQVQQMYQRQGELPMNMFALVGFIAGCVSLLLNFWGIVGIAALILSIVGIVQIGQNPARGKGFAIAGAILGGIGVLWGFVGLLMLL